jgi:hypothetical protein
MKNFLIPTTLNSDTIIAVETAINQSKGINSKIVLLFVSDEIDTFSTPHLLREMNSLITIKEQTVLYECRALIEQNPNFTMDFRRQFGITTPLFKNLIQFYATDLILFTPSFLLSKKTIHSYLVQIIENQKTPIFQLSKNKSNSLNRAVYIENSYSRLNLDDVQEFLKTQFPSQVISQILKKEEDNSEYINSLLSEILSKEDIDFVIETRRRENIKNKVGKKSRVNQHFDLPVLSLYEELI